MRDFTAFLSGLGIRIPEFLTMDFLSAARGHTAVMALLAKGQSLAQIFADQPQLEEAYHAWMRAPASPGTTTTSTRRGGSGVGCAFPGVDTMPMLKGYR